MFFVLPSKAIFSFFVSENSIAQIGAKVLYDTFSLNCIAAPICSQLISVSVSICILWRTSLFRGYSRNQSAMFTSFRLIILFSLRGF